MTAIHRRLGSSKGTARLLRVLVLWAGLMAVIVVSSGCDQHKSSDRLDRSMSSDLIWSFMINDSAADARIRKWNKSELRGLMIIDQARAEFYPQFSALLHQVGEGIGIKIEICRAIVRAGEVLSSDPGCEGVDFDFHFVITNGSWTASEWHQAQLVLQDQARELLATVRELLVTESRGKTCRYAIRTSLQIANQIELALHVIDSELPIVLGTCGTGGFLHMLGLYPFDGAQPLDPGKEAESLAEFLVKRTPYGGAYLLRLLYSPEVKPGMDKDEFVRTLPE
jgi:hypothetical protein